MNKENHISGINNSILGNNSISCKHNDINYEISFDLARLNHWHLQAVAREILQEKSITCCCRSLIKDITKVSIIETHNKTYSLSGVMRCGSVWKCPVCAYKVTEKRRKDLKKGMKNILENGAYSMMLTLTVPHYVSNSCEEVTTKISEALRKFFNRKGWKGSKKKKNGFAQKFGIIGRIRALEVTYTPRGWHPHFHILLLSDKELPYDKYESTTRAILKYWQTCCVAVGLQKPNKYGVQLSNSSKVDRYIAKWGIPEIAFTDIQNKLAEKKTDSLGIEEEMVKGFMKKGTDSSHVPGILSYTPFGILQKISDIDSEVQKLCRSSTIEEKNEKKLESYIWSCRFREYVKTFKGRRQLVYSEGLRSKMGLDLKEKTDSELAYEKEDGSRIFATIPLATWKTILSQEKRVELLEACRQGNDYLETWILNMLESSKLGSNKSEKNEAFRKLRGKTKKYVNESVK